MHLRLVVLSVLAINNCLAQEQEASDLIHSAMDHWRGTTSYSEMTMTIHRPDWQRTMSMLAWTAGEKQSLVRVTEPKKDAGNATLLDNKNMWTYSPKVNRIIKIPSSMMAQSWMGSDFSNKDISRSTDIIDSYTHTLSAVREADGHKIYVITSIPHEEAAVVWGKEVWTIRDDYVVLEEQFWDQDGVLVKSMKTSAIKEIGGRTVAQTMRMSKVESPDEWTEMSVNSIKFNIDIPANTFTQSNLRNPRR